MRVILAASIAVLLVVASGPIAAGLSSQSVHVRAIDSTVLSPNGVQVPKVYVLSAGGSVLFEGEPTADQPFAPIIRALREPTPVGNSRNSTPAIVALLERTGVELSAGKVPLLVTLEFGTSVGRCAACDPYYPDLMRAVAESGVDVRRIRVLFEKNDYPLQASK